MKILVLCEHSGSLSEAIAEAIPRSKVISVDLKPGDNINKRTHIVGDAIEVMESMNPIMTIGFPPCQYLCKAQLHMCNHDSDRRTKMFKAIEFVRKIYMSSAQYIMIENPEGILTRHIGKFQQQIQPYEFGDNYKKEINLWMKNIPNIPINPGDYSCIHKSTSNHVNARMSQNQKSEIRSNWKYYPKMCRAIALHLAKTLESIPETMSPVSDRGTSHVPSFKSFVNAGQH